MRRYQSGDAAAEGRRVKRRRVGPMSGVRRVAAMAQISRSLPHQRPHSFKRVTQVGDIQQLGGAQRLLGIEFKLNELPNVGEFTSLFDKYRIKAVQVKIVPVVSAYDINAPATAAFRPNIHSAIDYNDSTNPGSITDLFQYDNYRMTPGDRTHSRYFAPRVAQEVYRSAVSTNYAMLDKNVWLDCTAGGTDVPHFALKVCIDSVPGLPVDYVLSYKVYKTYFFETWNTR